MLSFQEWLQSAYKEQASGQDLLKVGKALVSVGLLKDKADKAKAQAGAQVIDPAMQRILNSTGLPKPQLDMLSRYVATGMFKWHLKNFYKLMRETHLNVEVGTPARFCRIAKELRLNR